MAMWKKTLTQYKKDLRSVENIVKDPKKDLLQPIPGGEGQTIIKEVLQIIDHTAYHTGELVAVLRTLGEWE